MANGDLTVLAIGMKKVAGVTEARVDYPMQALSDLPRTHVAWGSGGISIPKDPGVLVLHRQFMQPSPLRDSVERLIASGWIVVSDIDDDPRHWRGYVDSDFVAFRGVHAVTVSTPPLETMIRELNPNVMVFPNALPTLPSIASATPKQGRLKVFFGALNRGGDWGALMTDLGEAAHRLKDRVEFVVVHDRAFFDQLPQDVTKTFHPTLPHDQYMTSMAACDLALLPLADTVFNRLKSDLKFIECCAAGVVPICSPVVYDQDPRHLEIGVFATTPQSWAEALTALCERPEEVARRRALGLDYVATHRMHHQQAPIRAAYYRGLMLQRDRLEAERQVRLAAMATTN